MLTKLRALSTSLRGRLLIAFGLLILLTVLLTGLLAAWLTSNRFNILVTADGRAQARNVAPILEASYLLHGDWKQVDKLWKNSALAAQTPVSDTMDSHWDSGINLVEIIATTLDMSTEFFGAENGANPSTSAVIEQYGQSVDVVLDKLLAAEQKAVDRAVISGELTANEAEQHMASVSDMFRSFLTGMNYSTGVDWNKITADQLGLTKTALRKVMMQQTIAKFAQTHGRKLQSIAQAIIDAEIAAIRSGNFKEDNAVLSLSMALSQLDQYLGQPATTPDSSIDESAPQWTGVLSYYLQAGERLLLADPTGALIYDSAGEQQPGTQLQAVNIARGVPLYGRPNHERIGTLMITPGPDYYNSQQQSFLRNVIYSLFITGALAVLLALTAAYLLARQIIAPVSALTSAAQQIADGFTDARLPVTTQNELGRMSATFNQMAEALATQRTLRQRLVNDLSHELNTPLSVIQLEMQALRDGLQTPAQAFEQVQGEIELLRNLVRDLSNLETTDNGHFPLQCEPVDLLALAQRAIKRWQAKAESKGVTLTLTAPLNLLPITEADPARLTQVLGNLLDNALRHTETGGAITVACQVTTLAALTLPPAYRPVTALPVPGLAMTVSDTGCGIPAADLPHLFERFYRVDSSRNRRSGGRGLGLAIVRQIITAHGGHLWVRSSEGQGSCFGFWLPINEIE